MGACGCHCLPGRAAPKPKPGSPPLLEAKRCRVEGWRVLEAALDAERRCLDPALTLSSSGEACDPGDLAPDSSFYASCEELQRGIHSSMDELQQPMPDWGEEPAGDELRAELLLDEPDARYCLCRAERSSPLVLGYLRLRFSDVHLGDAWHALVNAEERRERDPESEYAVLRPSRPEDPTREEVSSYVMRPPWPFQEREVLQRCWQLPLEAQGPGPLSKLGIAIVMESLEDDALLAPTSERIRARVHEGAFLLRPLGPATHPGVEVTVVQHLDLGGSCPHWAQTFMSRYTVQTARRWAEALRTHCVTMRARRQEVGQEVGDGWRTNVQLPLPIATAKRAPTLDELLAGIMALERHVLDCAAGGAGSPEMAHMSVEQLHDEATRKYFLCQDDSPVMIAMICADLEEAHLGDVWSTLTASEDLKAIDPASEYEELQASAPGDPTREQIATWVYRFPSPLTDRDVCVRRWQKALPSATGDGIVIVARSCEEPCLVPVRSDRVRATVIQCGYLLRPLRVNEDGSDKGVRVHCVQQADLGTTVPPWLSSFLKGVMARGGLDWADNVLKHSQKMRAQRAARGCPIGESWKL